MSKNDNDIFDGHYRYFSYPINDISNIFGFGMPIKGFSLEGRIISNSFNEKDIQKYLDHYYNYPSKYICILKIPTHYFGYMKIEGKYTPFMPLLHIRFDYFNGEKNYITPELILGIFNTTTKEYQENPDYSPIFNPVGLQFTDEQIYTMKICHSQRTADYALARRNIPYWTLLEQDMENGVLEPTIDYYDALSHANSKENNYLLQKKPSK